MPPKEKHVPAGKQTTLKGFFSKSAQQNPQSSRVPTSSKIATPKVKPSNGDAIDSSSIPSSASKITSPQSTGSATQEKTPATTPAAVSSSPIAMDEDDDGVEVVLTTVCPENDIYAQWINVDIP